MHSKFSIVPAALTVSASAALLIPASAATYYAAPASKSAALSTNPKQPGTLSYAMTNAPTGSTVILEDGVYDGAPGGFTVVNSGVTFQSEHWHAATIKNTKASDLIGPKSESVTGDIIQGIVFGPAAGIGWSGGGSAGWKFLDCVFTLAGGVTVGSNGVFERCVFSDSVSNCVDLNFGKDQLIKDSILRRSNRISADDDSVGNKQDFSTGLTLDGVVAYDNNGAAMWFDTSNDGWTVKNSTFFANHGGNNWLTCSVRSGTSTTQFTGDGQDGEGLHVGQHLKGYTGTAANIGQTTVITAVSGGSFTVSPALPATPASGDVFIVQHGRVSVGDGFITEANDNGIFTDNVLYSNTHAGYFDHASGGSRYGSTGGLIVTNNLFAYNGQDFNFTPDGRDDGPAVIKFNQFKFRPGAEHAIVSEGGNLGSYAGPLHVVFDYNIYNPSGPGEWATWFPGDSSMAAGGLTDGSQPAGQDYLQNPATWNQDQHSVVAPVKFWGTPPLTTSWPIADDTDWNHIFYPNNTFGLTNSIHQIDDTDGAVENTIDAAVAEHKAGDVVMIPVSAHSPIDGTTCQVYDLNGRWITLDVPVADQADLLATIPPYVSCVPGNKTTTFKIRALLTSTDQYNMTATYTRTSGTAPIAPALLSVTPGSDQNLLVWKAVPSASTYSVYRTNKAGGKVAAPIAAGIKTTSFTDNAAKDGSTCNYTVQAANTYGVGPASNEISARPHLVTGSLAGSEVTASTSSYDLTALGTIDWRHWGDMGGPNSKMTGGGQISDLKQFGKGKFGSWRVDKRLVGWTDNINMISNTADQNYICCYTAQDSGWTFTVPADTTKRTLNVLWGGSAPASVKLEARLSDGSAPDYTATHSVTAAEHAGLLLETITYNAAKPGQTLTITLTNTTPSRADAPSLDLQAAWLH